MPVARVLYLTTSGQVGGAERCLLSLLHGLDRGRYEPTVIIGSPGPLASMVHSLGVPATTCAWPPALRRWGRYHRRRAGREMLQAVGGLPGYLRRLRQQVRDCRPALIHTNGIKMHYAAALLSRGSQVPLIWQLHDFPADIATEHPGQDGQPAANRLFGWLSARTARVVANSQAVADAHLQRFPRLASRMSVIHNGVDAAVFERGDGAGLRREAGFAPGDFVAGMVAIFAPWKGQEVFLRAARIAREAVPAMKFLLVGDDVYDTGGHGGRRQQLQVLTTELGLDDAVRFTGFLEDDIAAGHAALDVMVHASTRPEPFGRTIIEAMASRRPVIAADGGGVTEIVQHGQNGWLVPPGDATALAAAMVRLHRDPALRQRLAAAGAATARARFSEAAIDKRWVGLYDAVLETPPG